MGVRHDNNVYRIYGNSVVDYIAPSGNYNHIAYDWGYISPYTWAVRNNGGITKIRIWIGGAVHSISREIPNHFSLSQNYPNPFNPKSKIKMQIAKLSMVKLVVFDALGREVETLVNEQLNAGTYEVNFDGSKYSSGIYYYQLTVNSEQLKAYRETKKMIFIK